MNRILSLGLAALAALAIAPSTRADEKNAIPAELRAVLEKADAIELYSLSPKRGEKVEGQDAFHGWRVLGRTTVKDNGDRTKLVKAFKKGVDDNAGEVAACFNPRHGIRVTHDKKTVDFVICFECLQVAAYVGDKREKGFLITKTPQKVFDGVLKAAKVELAEKE